jgi:translation initiation factor IF-3
MIRLINEDGEDVGIVSLSEGLNMAATVWLDLIEVSPNADPPVCKIIDYGKYKYEIQKKKAEARKKQKIIEVKEIKFHPNIDDNDYEVKLRAIRKFLDEGCKVKLTLRFRGREMAHQDLGIKLFDRIREQLDNMNKVEQFPKMEGRQMIMIIAPR